MLARIAKLVVVSGIGAAAGHTVWRETHSPTLWLMACLVIGVGGAILIFWSET